MLPEEDARGLNAQWSRRVREFESCPATSSIINTVFNHMQYFASLLVVAGTARTSHAHLFQLPPH